MKNVVTKFAIPAIALLCVSMTVELSAMESSIRKDAEDKARGQVAGVCKGLADGALHPLTMVRDAVADVWNSERVYNTRNAVAGWIPECIKTASAATKAKFFAAALMTPQVMSVAQDCASDVVASMSAESVKQCVASVRAGWAQVPGYVAGGMVSDLTPAMLHDVMAAATPEVVQNMAANVVAAMPSLLVEAAGAGLVLVVAYEVLPHVLKHAVLAAKGVAGKAQSMVGKKQKPA